jgi:hypothetical protein
MNTSRRVLITICIVLSLTLLTVVTFEFKTKAAARSSTAILPTTVQQISSGHVRRSLWQTPQTTSPAQKEKTIGETHKNVKVLTDLPSSELIPMMNLIAASLGVKCNFCHVNKNGQWEYHLDDKPEKITAREMIAMTMNVNKTTFKGNLEVSCFTCHRGLTHPAGQLALPIPEPTPRAASGTAAGAPAAQPTADDILNKYTAAIGGQAAIDKLKTRVMKGTYTLASGATGTYEVAQTSSDKFYVARSLPQGLSEQGFNGSEGWQKDGRGVIDIPSEQLTDLKAAYQFFHDFKLKEQFTRMNLRRDKINGRDVFAITGIRPDKKRERLFFDAETGLLVRRMGYTETPLGVIPDQTDYEDYREVDGVKIPFTVKIYVVGGFSTAVRTFTDVKINVPVEDSRFSKPASTPAPPKP